ncbi:MAG: hypothetical protein AAB337_02895 [Patescibacteria group bacterium]
MKRLNNKHDVYDMLNHETIWYRHGGPEEVGHSALYLPTCAVLRERPDDVHAEIVHSLIKEFTTLYGLNGTALSIMPNGEDHFTLIKTAHATHPARQHLLFEGYGLSSEQEGVAVHRQLARKASEHSFTVTISSGRTVDAWNTKPYFRERVTEAFGEDAVPPGVRLEAPRGPAEIVHTIKQMFKIGVKRVIVKVNGSGGEGNTIVTLGDDIKIVAEKVIGQISGVKEKWVSVEAWIPWQITGCCSFFLADSHAPIPMTLVQQVLSPITAGFIGSRSILDITYDDQQAIIEHTARIVDDARVEGVRGFCGADFIISLPGQTKNEFLLPSGLALRYIEATPRVGGHNQELKALSMIAKREGMMIDDFIHLRVCNKPVSNTASRDDVRLAIKTTLRDLAEPFDARPIREGDVRFLLDCNFGEQTQTHYDAIMLVSRRGRAEAKIRAAFEHLESLGMLQT